MKLAAIFDYSAMTLRFGVIRDRSLPWAVCNALNDTAFLAAKDLRAGMQKSFDRPTPFALNSIRITYANPKTGRLFAEIWLKDDYTVGGKGTPATKYMKAEIEGGPRGLKSSELALQRVGAMPAGTFWEPGRAAQIDAYGNQSVGQIIQMMSWFQAQRDKTANTPQKKKDKLWKGNYKQPVAYFIGRPGGGRLPLGIYERKLIGLDDKGRQVTAIHPIAIFTKAPNYKVRFPFFDIVRKAYNSFFPAAIARAWRREVTGKWQQAGPNGRWKLEGYSFGPTDTPDSRR